MGDAAASTSAGDVGTSTDDAPLPRPAPRLDLRVLLVAVFAGVGLTTLVLVAAPTLPRLVATVPAVLTVTLVCSVASSWLLHAYARVESDPALPWLAVGYGTAALALALHLAAFPTVAPTGGPLGTTADGTAALYLLWHLVVAGAALLALVPQLRGHHRIAAAVPVVATVLVAWGRTPLPALTTDDGSFTTTYVAGLAVTTLLTGAAAWRWMRAAGRATTWPRGWVGVALVLHTWDVASYTFGQRRFSPLWWASLGMRVAAFAVLAGGLVAGLLAAHRAWSRFAGEAEGLVRQRERDAASLAQANAELQSFAHVVAHDLRSPLAAAAGFVELVRSGGTGDLPPDARDLLDRAASQHGRMDRLITDLLEYASVANADLEPEPVDLAALARDVVEARDATGAVDLGPLPTVVGDPERLRQLLDNLVGNALKYVPPDTVPEVAVHAEAADGRVRLCVEDRGIGIDPALAERIFQPFVRSNDARRSYPGTGIGLAICQRVAEQHGGSIRVEPRSGGGSRFTVELPAAGPAA